MFPTNGQLPSPGYMQFSSEMSQSPMAPYMFFSGFPGMPAPEQMGQMPEEMQKLMNEMSSKNMMSPPKSISGNNTDGYKKASSKSNNDNNSKSRKRTHSVISSSSTGSTSSPVGDNFFDDLIFDSPTNKGTNSREGSPSKKQKLISSENGNNLFAQGDMVTPW